MMVDFEIAPPPFGKRCGIPGWKRPPWTRTAGEIMGKILSGINPPRETRWEINKTGNRTAGEIMVNLFLGLFPASENTVRLVVN